MNDENTIQKDLADRLISALRQDGFVLYAQPIVSLDGRGQQPMFQEILTRFREEEEKLLPPGSFFPLLEEYGLLPYLDRWVVSRLAHWIKSVRAEKPNWPVPANSINLSTDTLYDSNFADYVRKHAQNAQLPAGTMTFELSLENAGQHAEALQDLAAKIKPAGCRFTLAGFDGAEESFRMLETVAPDFVKLSYALVKDIDRALVSSEKLERVNSRCHSMRVKTIAEYVESNETLEQLRLIGVDFAQGMGISPPRKLR